MVIGGMRIKDDGDQDNGVPDHLYRRVAATHIPLESLYALGAKTSYKLPSYHRSTDGMKVILSTIPNAAN